LSFAYLEEDGVLLLLALLAALCLLAGVLATGWTAASATFSLLT